VMTERQVLPTSGDLETGGDIDHVHDGLCVVAGDPRGACVALAEALVPVAHPIGDPPPHRPADAPEPTALLRPLVHRELGVWRPRGRGQRDLRTPARTFGEWRRRR